MIRVHDTRHTCGKLPAALDVHPRLAMQIPRHSEISLTVEIYTEVPSEQTRAALNRLAEHLGSGDDSGGKSAWLYFAAVPVREVPPKIGRGPFEPGAGEGT